MELIRRFEQISKNDAYLAGGKGASLGEMTQAVVPVPPGFVILSEAFDRFLEETDLDVEIDSILHSVNHQEMHTVEYASEKIQALILDAKMPSDLAKEIKVFFKKLNAKYVAVRSSATAEDSASAAWAGQLDSFLNTTDKTLLENVQKCWASLFTPRAIFYRFEKRLHKTKISVAVVIQKMVESESSGIAFSVHPVTQDYNQLIIEAGFGLGEAIVSGQITPDSYVVEKNPRRIIDKNIATQTRSLIRANRRVVGGAGNEWVDILEPKASSQVLTETQILELSELILKIEEHYGFPCDIEWAREKGKFYIVQSRPITTLKDSNTKTTSKKITLSPFGTREFTLAFMELLFRSEKREQAWLGGSKPPGEYFAGEFKEGLLHMYMDPASIDWVKKEAVRQHAANPALVDEIVNNATIAIAPYVSLLKNPRALTKREFKNFITGITVCWSWLAGMWWLLEAYEGKEQYRNDFTKLLQLRKDTDYSVPAINSVLALSFIKAFPGLRELTTVLTLEEYFSGKSAGEKEMRGRLSSGFVVESGVFFGESVTAKKSEYIFESHDTTGDITGIVAMKGIYRGRVKVVQRLQDMKEVQKGDVFVASTTIPQWLAGLQLAGAIVADEGGIISHAAIISRELKKPCIIGTKIATQVLKDGDLVEVDADMGVVRVLEKRREEGEKSPFSAPQKWEYAFMLGNQDVDTSFLTLEMTWAGMYDPRVAKQIGVSVPDTFEEITKGTTINTYVLEKPITVFAEKAAQALLSKPKLLQGLKKGTVKSANAIRLFANRHIKKLERYDVQKLAQLLLEIKKLQSLCVAYGTVIAWADITGILSQNIMDVINRRSKLKYPRHWYSHVLGSPVEPSLTQQATAAIKKSKILTGMLEKYYWLNQGYIGTGLTLEEIRTIKQNSSEKDHEYIFASAQELQSELKLNKNELRNFQVSREVIFMKSLRADSRQYLHVVTNLIAQRLAHIWHIDSALVRSMYAEEIADIINNNKPLPSDLSARSERSVFVPDGFGHYKILVGHKAVEFVKKTFQQESISKATTLKGQTAYQGQAKGKVKLVFGPQHNDKVEEGDILISTATSPQLLPAMMRAAAFVTDVGGITSHAAIVARELKKPCVVGTKIATQLLKDGDLVEVDAEKGVVRVIKKKDHGVGTITFTQIFSREKPLFYFCLWNESDRKGWQDFFSYQIQANLFRSQGLNHRTSVWYDQSELDHLKIMVQQRCEKEKNQFARKLFHRLDAHWPKIFLYLSGKKKIGTPEEFFQYYTHLVEWWSAMNTTFFSIPDIKEIPLDIRKKFLAYRQQAEPYAEVMSNVMTNFWSLSYPEYKDLAYVLTPQEAIEIAKHGVSASKKQALRKRLQGYGMLNGKVYSTDELSRQLAVKRIVLNKADGDGEKTFKGSVAFAGKVRGRVRVVMTHKELKEFTRGEVLVTPMTTPDYVPFMKKAAAIVTDEGGITCHAAIVSRELKKPCIIGTKIATQVLKDGDLVEVDADKGVVRMIEGSEEKGNNQHAFVQKFTKRLSGNKPYLWHGPFSPLIFTPWSAKSGPGIVLAGVSKGKEAFWLVDEQAYQQYAKDTFRDFLYSKVSIKQLKKRFDDTNHAIQRVYKDICLQSLRGIEEESLTSSMQKSTTLFVQLLDVTLFIETFDLGMASSIVKKSERAKLKKAWDIGAHPLFLSFEHRWFQKVMAELEKYNTRTVANNCRYILSDFYFSKTLDEAVPEIMAIKKNAKNSEEKLKKLQHELKRQKREYDLFLKNASVTTRRIAEFTQFVMKLRDVRKDPISMSFTIFSDIARELGKRAGLDAAIIPFINCHEYIKGVSWLKENKKEIQMRKNGVAGFIDPTDHSVEFRACDFNEVKSQLESLLDVSKDTISGQVAYKGLVRGIARIVIDPSKAGDFEAGSVLVASMTRPDFIPLMKKAGAVVTNEGGITCHAAIVSRELRIPCIIGTKIATQVLKDGDLVEVDAVKGVVRVIERVDEQNNQSEQELLTVLPNTKWHYLHKRLRTPFYIYLIFEGTTKHYYNELRFPYEIKEVVTLAGDLALGKNEWERLRALTKKKFIHDSHFLVDLLKESYQANKQIELLAKKLGKTKEMVDQELLIQQWNQYLDLVYRFGAYVLLPLFVETHMEETLKAEIAKRFPSEKREEVFQVLTTPIKAGSTLQEETSLLRLAILRKQRKNILTEIQKHLDDFSWIKNNSFNGDFYTEKELLERIAHLLRGDPKEAYRAHQEKIQHEKEKFRSYRNIFRGNKKALILIDTLQESIYFRSWRSERYYRNAYFLRPFFEQTVQRLGLKNTKDLFYLTPPEILDALSGKRKIDQKKIKQRLKSFGVYSNGEKTIILSGSTVDKLKQKIHFFEHKDTQELRGQVAFAGFVKGFARIVPSKLELQKIRQGDILITTSTTPDFVPALKRVKAIVAEEGGVLSHASVISRELHIPCLIGVKGATRVLKDGDLVEVDADKGVVKIIKRA